MKEDTSLPESLSLRHLLYGKMRGADQHVDVDLKEYPEQEEWFVCVGLRLPRGAFSRTAIQEFEERFQSAAGNVEAQRQVLLSLTQRLFESISQEGEV